MALCDLWQQLTQGRRANNCIHAVCAIQSALAKWGVDAKPVTVTAVVEWPSIRTELGQANPTWRKTRRWSGHLGLWVPSLGRFLDPTLYQVNQPHAPTQITRGVIVPLHPEQLGANPFTKNGATVQYRLVDDPGPSWLTGLPAGRAGEIAATSATYREALEAFLNLPELLTIREALTDETLAEALRPLDQT